MDANLNAHSWPVHGIQDPDRLADSPWTNLTHMSVSGLLTSMRRRATTYALVAGVLLTAMSLVSPGSAGAVAPACNASSYVNVYGHCVKRPQNAPRVPAGATAQCRDRTFSFSASRRGTCSWHGGVARWL